MKLTHIADRNLQKYCAENTSNALNVAFRMEENVPFTPLLNFRSVSEDLFHSLPSPPPFKTNSDVKDPRVPLFQRWTQLDISVFAVGNDKVKLPL